MAHSISRPRLECGDKGEGQSPLSIARGLQSQILLIQQQWGRGEGIVELHIYRLGSAPVGSLTECARIFNELKLNVTSQRRDELFPQTVNRLAAAIPINRVAG